MRPSWHVDAKWLAALAAVLLVFAASIAYTAYRLTEHDTATGAFTAIAVSLLEDQVDGEEWERIRAEAAANPQTEYYVPGVNVTVTGAEIAQSTLPQALELVVGRVADTLYYEGSDAAEPLFAEEPPVTARPIGGGQPGADPPAAGEVERSLDPGPFAVLSEDSHDFLRPVALALALLSLVPLALLAVFSRGFGRLGAPGMAVLAGLAPLALVTTLVERAVAERPDDLGGRLVAAIDPAASDLSSLYLLVAAVGGIAIIFSMLSNAVSATLDRRSRRREKREEEERSIARIPSASPTYVSREGFSGFMPSEKGAIDPGGVPQT